MDDSSRPLRRFFSILGLCIAVKVMLVVSLADVFFYGEELEKGTAAKAPHHQLAYHYYEGGGFVISHLKALAFLVVGENILAHKLVAILAVVLVLWAGWRLVERHFGVRAATYFGLLYIFAAASFQKLTLLSLGIHFESAFFALMVFDYGLRLVVRQEPRTRDIVVLDDGMPLVALEEARSRDMFVFGLMSGLGIYFSYQVALVVGFIGLLLLLLRRDVVFAREGLVGASGLLFGLTPLLITAALVGGEVFNIHGTALLDENARGARETLQVFFDSLYKGKSWSQMVGPVVYPLASFGAAIWLLVWGRRASSKAAVLSGFVLFWGAIYMNSAFVVGDVIHDFLLLRFSLLWLVGLVLLAAALGRAKTVPVARGLVGLLVALGLWNTVTVILEGSPGTLVDNVRVLARTKGYDYQGYFAKLLPHLAGEEEARLEKLLGFDEPDRSLLYSDMALEAFRSPEVLEADVLTILAALDSDALPDFARGLGPYQARRSGWNLEQAVAKAREVDGELGEALLEGVGRFGVDWAVLPETLEAEIAQMAGRPGLEPYFRGVGYRFYRRCVLGPRSGVRFALKPWRGREFLERQPQSVRAALIEGFDAAEAEHSL